MFDDTIEALTYPTVADRGRQVPDYDQTPTAVAITGVDLQPGPSTELVAQRASATSIRWTVYIPTDRMPSPALTENSIVRVRGSEVCQVDGRPQPWGDIALGHYIVALKEWSPR